MQTSHPTAQHMGTVHPHARTSAVTSWSLSTPSALKMTATGMSSPTAHRTTQAKTQMKPSECRCTLQSRIDTVTQRASSCVTVLCAGDPSTVDDFTFPPLIWCLLPRTMHNDTSSTTHHHHHILIRACKTHTAHTSYARSTIHRLGTLLSSRVSPLLLRANTDCCSTSHLSLHHTLPLPAKTLLRLVASSADMSALCLPQRFPTLACAHSGTYMCCV
jgi:hypothetical protein